MNIGSIGSLHGDWQTHAAQASRLRGRTQLEDRPGRAHREDGSGSTGVYQRTAPVAPWAPWTPAIPVPRDRTAAPAIPAPRERDGSAVTAPPADPVARSAAPSAPVASPDARESLVISASPVSRGASQDAAGGEPPVLPPPERPRDGALVISYLPPPAR